MGRQGGSTSEQQPALGIGGRSGIAAAEVGSARGRGAGASAGAAQMVPTAQGCPAVSWPNALAKTMTACLFSKFSACCGTVLLPASSEDAGLEVVTQGSFSVASSLVLFPWGCLHLGLGEGQPRCTECPLHPQAEAGFSDEKPAQGRVGAQAGSNGGCLNALPDARW